MKWPRTVVALFVVAVASSVHVSAAGVKRIAVDMHTPGAAVPPRVEVDDDARIEIVITKNILQECSVVPRAEDIKEANPLATIIAIVAKAFGGVLTGAQLVGPRGVPPPRPRTCPAPKPPPDGDAEARVLESALAEAVHRVGAVEQAIDDYDASLQRLSQRVEALTRCIDVDEKGFGSFACQTVSDFATARDRLVGDLIGFVDRRPVPGVEIVSAEMESVKKGLLGLAGKGTSDAARAWLENALDRADCVSERIDTVVERRKVFASAREQMRTFLGAAIAFQPNDRDAQNMRVPLRPTQSANVTVTVSCKNHFTRQQTVPLHDGSVADVDPMTIVVRYASAPRVSVSTGVMYSWLGKLQYGPQQFKTGSNATTGEATFVTKITATDVSKTEIVPFAMLNGRAAGTRQVALYGSLGIGLNANNGTKQVEYFVGPAVAIKSAYVAFGRHFGRVQSVGGAFAADDVITDKTTVPIERSYKSDWAVVLSYKLPLP